MGLFNEQGQLSRSQLEQLEAMTDQQQVQAVATAYAGLLVPVPGGVVLEPFQADSAASLTFQDLLGNAYVNVTTILVGLGLKASVPYGAGSVRIDTDILVGTRGLAIVSASSDVQPAIRVFCNSLTGIQTGITKDNQGAIIPNEVYLNLLPTSLTQQGVLKADKSFQFLGNGNRSVAGNLLEIDTETVGTSLEGYPQSLVRFRIPGITIGSYPFLLAASLDGLGSLGGSSGLGSWGIGVGRNVTLPDFNKMVFNIGGGGPGSAYPGIAYAIGNLPGIDVTVALAKLTPTGSDGVLNINGGIVTGYTAPT